MNARLHLRFVREQGFTLLELLISLVLLSLVFLLLLNGLRYGTKVWERQEAQTGAIENLSVQNFLRRELSEARPVMIEAGGGSNRHVYFDGRRDSIRFIAPMPAHVGAGGFDEIAIYLAKGDQTGRKLEMSWRAFRAGSVEPLSRQQKVTLLEGVNDIDFDYYGYRGVQDRTGWYGDWRNTQFWPSLIRMRVTFTQGDRAWPDLVVSPLVRVMNVVIQPD